MSEAEEAAISGSDDGGSQEDQPVSPIVFHGQFMKDLSFEIPDAPGIFDILQKQAPDIPLSVDCHVRALTNNRFEVTISIHVEATIQNKTAFMLEIVYAAVVSIGEVPPAHIHPVLLIEVPRQLFPFVRQIVADITVSGGFPPLMLQIIDFKDLYERKYAADAREWNDKTQAPQNKTAVDSE